MRWTAGFAAALGVALSISCSAPQPKTCTPGQSASCFGPAGCQGAQVCNAAGTGYDACTCGSGGSGGNGGTGGGSGGGTGGTGGSGGGGAASCNGTNCSGCCSGSACIPFNQTNALTCGINGAACVSCPGTQTCSFGACTGAGGGTGGAGGGAGGGTGGGSGGGTGGAGGGSGGGTGGGTGGAGGGGSSGCNASNCNGCCAGSACIPLNSTSSINCGANGVACQACGAGQNCASGVCVTPDAGATGNVGDGCSAAGDCFNVPTSSGGGPTFCKKFAMVFDGVNAPTNGYAYPGGYCTRRCTSSAQCGTSAKCVFYLGFLGDMENICLASCASSACRVGYICVNFGSTASPLPLCIVADADGGLLPDYDAGRAANDNVMGQSCADNAACMPPASGNCIPALLPDGGPTGYPNGSCTADCSMAVYDEWCGSDAGACIPSAYSTSQGPLVLWSCERFCDPAAGNTGCRTEYYCDMIYGTSYPNYGVCTPKCTNAGITCPGGTTCNVSTGVCQ